MRTAALLLRLCDKAGIAARTMRPKLQEVQRYMTGVQGRREERGTMGGAAASIGGSSVAAHHLYSPRCSPSTPSLRQPYALLLPVGGRSPTRPESRYSIYTLRLKLEGLGNIRDTYLACAPFLCHAHVKCFLAALLSYLRRVLVSPVAVSIHTRYASRVHRAPRHPMPLGVGRPQTGQGCHRQLAVVH